jgi:hypothetical protein
MGTEIVTAITSQFAQWQEESNRTTKAQFAKWKEESESTTKALMEEIKAMKKELNEVRHLNTVAASVDEKPSIKKKIKNRQKKKKLFSLVNSTPFMPRMGTRNSPSQDFPKAQSPMDKDEANISPIITSADCNKPKRRLSPRLQQKRERSISSSPVGCAEDFSSQLLQETALVPQKRCFSTTNDVSSNVVAQLLKSNNRMVALNTFQTMQTQNALIVNQILRMN